LLKKRIKELLEANECRGAFNAEPSLDNLTYSPTDFVYLCCKLHNSMEIEVLSSKDARFFSMMECLSGFLEILSKRNFLKSRSSKQFVAEEVTTLGLCWMVSCSYGKPRRIAHSYKSYLLVEGLFCFFYLRT
jgi:hypothetical protein